MQIEEIKEIVKHRTLKRTVTKLKDKPEKQKRCPKQRELYSTELGSSEEGETGETHERWNDK